MRKIILYSLAFSSLALAALVAIPWTALAQKTAPEPMIRIALLKEIKDVEVEIKGEFRLLDPLTNQELLSARKLRRCRVVPGEKGIIVNGKEYPFQQLRFSPQEEMTIFWDSRVCKYRGTMDVTLTDKKKFLLINRVGLEDYVQGILYHEVSSRWHMEALKSQAVISRTYALYQIRVNAKKPYDVTSDIYSQVYGGRSAERYRTNLAVKQTAGEVLTYQAKIIPTYFYATCGGYTEDVRELWDHDEDLPPLRGVRCGYCGHSPHSWWKRNLKLKDIQDKLTANAYPVGPILDIFILERNPSGRIRKMEILSREGKRTVISGKDFRNIVGPNLIRSNDYYVIVNGYYVDFVGRGWGHGVGLCQWGAHGMAEKGFNHQNILAHYYPGADLVDYRSLPLFQK